MSDITRIIDSIRNGDEGAADSLFETVYDELRRIADYQLTGEKSGHTLQTTALVNEVYLRLFEGEAKPSWDSRAHFFGTAAEAMRRILVDHARKRKSKKRGGEFRRDGTVTNLSEESLDLDEVLDVSEALEQLHREHPEKAQLVKLRYFAGLTMNDTANVLNISLPTANRHWAFARAWLFRRIHSEN